MKCEWDGGCNEKANFVLFSLQSGNTYIACVDHYLAYCQIVIDEFGQAPRLGMN